MITPCDHHRINVNFQAAQFVEFMDARFALMHQVELRYVSLGVRTRSGRLVNVHHLGFLS